MPTARIAFEADERGGVTVVLDGHPQSYVDLADPGLLAFEYVQHLALVLDTLPAGRIAVTHVGGAGLTLPRYVEHTRPGSPQVVLEPDAALTAEVRRRLPLPRGHRIRVRPLDGYEGTAALATGSADALVLDAYAGGRLPARLASAAYLREAARVLRPSGVLAVNLADEPGLRYVAGFVATTSAAGFEQVALLATHDVLKGRRFGNVVLAAGRGGLDVDALTRGAARSPIPTGSRAGEALARFVAGARAWDDGQASPPPPDPGRWRIR
ncbi:MAG: fused MFS/spermidine synthase [Dermatophilaceae bacterium]